MDWVVLRAAFLHEAADMLNAVLVIKAKHLISESLELHLNDHVLNGLTHPFLVINHVADLGPVHLVDELVFAIWRHLVVESVEEHLWIPLLLGKAYATVRRIRLVFRSNRIAVIENGVCVARATSSDGYQASGDDNRLHLRLINF